MCIFIIDFVNLFNMMKSLNKTNKQTKEIKQSNTPHTHFSNKNIYINLIKNAFGFFSTSVPKSVKQHKY